MPRWVAWGIRAVVLTLVALIVLALVLGVPELRRIPGGGLLLVALVVGVSIMWRATARPG